MFMDTIARTKLWFEKAFAAPTTKNFHTQVGVHFEEVNEMVMALKSPDFETQTYLDTASMALNALANHLKKSDGVLEIRDRMEFLDALCDQVVTSVGCAHGADLDIVGGMFEVNRSNFSKFVNEQPLFDENLKVIKGPGYEKADLAPYV